MILGPNLIKIALIVSLIVGLSYKNNIGDILGNDRSCIYHNQLKPIIDHENFVPWPIIE